METQVENSGLDVISKQEIDSKMPDEIAGGIIEPASVTIKKEIIDTELNPSVPDFENFIGNNDPINIKSEDIHTIIDNSHEEETYQHMMIGAEIMSEDESEEKTLHLKGEVIDMELENVKEEPAEKYSESSEDESHIESNENSGYTELSGHLEKFKCNTCDYRTTRRTRMKKHTKVHKSPSELTMYSCNVCPFQTKHKDYIKTHCSIVHAPADSELKKYTCKKCSFWTYHKHSLVNHQLTHLDVTDTYKCDHCDYETNNKLVWGKHVGTHQPKKKILHRCSLCPYTSKLKTGVSNHMTVHKKSSETTMYECELCPYKTKWPHCLRNHLKTHKEEQVPVHKCQHCDFQANNKYSLATHDAKKHQERVPKLFKCSICDHQTRQRHKLKNHMETHKALSERQTFSCAQCGIKTLDKLSLKRHVLLKHVDLTQFEIEKEAIE